MANNNNNNKVAIRLLVCGYEVAITPLPPQMEQLARPIAMALFERVLGARC